MLVSSDLSRIIYIVAERRGMIAKFFISGEGNLERKLEEIARKRQGGRLRSQL
jgi:hypothetical protein